MMMSDGYPWGSRLVPVQIREWNSFVKARHKVTRGNAINTLRLNGVNQSLCPVYFNANTNQRTGVVVKPIYSSFPARILPDKVGASISSA